MREGELRFWVVTPLANRFSVFLQLKHKQGNSNSSNTTERNGERGVRSPLDPDEEGIPLMCQGLPLFSFLYPQSQVPPQYPRPHQSRIPLHGALIVSATQNVPVTEVNDCEQGLAG